MEALGVSRATVFRLLKRYREDQRTSSMLPRSKGPKRVMQPLEPEIEAIVRHHFTRLYATRRKPTQTRFWREVAADCRRDGLPAPSIRRLGRWLELQDQADLMRRREGKGKSEPIFLATPGSLAAAKPVDIVQIDHTKADVTVVAPVTRLAVGRPTLTLARTGAIPGGSIENGALTTDRLTSAVIIYWNTKHLGQAVTQRQRASLDCSPNLLAHISPLGWAHILLTGEYRWRKQRSRLHKVSPASRPIL